MTKKPLLILIVSLFSINLQSQISFEPGYFIDNSDQRITCLIKNMDWKSNPDRFDYKTSEASEVKRMDISMVKEFSIQEEVRFIRSTVEMDRSSTTMSNISTEMQAIFHKETLFLEVLQEGKASLYYYRKGTLKRYFYQLDSGRIEQLVYKKFKRINDKIYENNEFQSQLWNKLKCNSISMPEIEKLSYSKKSLNHFFLKYNSCNGSTVTNYVKKSKPTKFNFSLRPRLNLSKLTVRNIESDFRDAEFATQLNFGLGAEVELILPFHKNRWALVFEPAYLTYSGAFTAERILLGPQIVHSELKYSAVDCQFGGRYYHFMDNRSKLFFNLQYMWTFTWSSSLVHSKEDGRVISSIPLENSHSFAAGLGYKLDDKYSVEVRHFMYRNILANLVQWNSDYPNISVIFGYTF